MRYIKKKIRSRVRKVLLIGAVCVVLVIGALVFMRTPAGRNMCRHWSRMQTHISTRANLKLANVIVSGHNRTSLPEINAVLNVSRGMPIFDVNLEQIQEALKQLPWIQAVVVQRILPDTVSIRIAEKIPMALWQNKRQHWPIDADGKVIEDSGKTFPELLLVVGADAPQRARFLIESLSAYPVLLKRARSATRVGGRRWTLRMDDAEAGAEVYLPDTDIRQALARLNDLQRQEKILDRDIGVIDLRLPDRLVIQSAAAKRKGN